MTDDEIDREAAQPAESLPPPEGQVLGTTVPLTEEETRAEPGSWRTGAVPHTHPDGTTCEPG
jgi:hypothetical protein